MVSLAGCLQAKSMTSYRAVQDGGYSFPWQRYDNKMAAIHNKKTIITCSVYTSNSKSTVWACYRCILHLQQYSHRLNLFFSLNVSLYIYSVYWHPQNLFESYFKWVRHSNIHMSVCVYHISTMKLHCRRAGELYWYCTIHVTVGL